MKEDYDIIIILSTEPIFIHNYGVFCQKINYINLITNNYIVSKSKSYERIKIIK